MPKLKNRLPSYRCHKHSGQAVVTLNGRDVYLGPYNTDESRASYERVLNEWLINHRRTHPAKPDHAGGCSQPDLTINELFLVYWEFAVRYYRKNGQPTSEVNSIRRALKPMLELYGQQFARSFGPLGLKACRQRMIDDGLTRGAINKHVSRCKRFFRWASENELVSPGVYQGISTVSGLRRGRTPAPESQPIRPVPDELVDATLTHLNRYVAAMVQLQRLAGMRPCEVTIMRTCDLDASNPVWSYRPQSHKMEHHDRERIVYLGSRAQEILRPFLLADREACIFSPKLVLAEHRAQLRARRETPMTPSQRKRRPRQNARKKPGEHYTTCSYEHAIRTACDKAFPVPPSMTEEQAKHWRREHRWAPNQLRHAVATRLRSQFGLDAARVVLGHSSPVVTEIYAEIDHLRAADVMAKVG